MNVQVTGRTITLPRPALTDLSMPGSKRIVVGFWIVTVFFCLQMGFTAYAQLSLPVVAEAFTHLGFPGWFRVDLSWAKLAMARRRGAGRPATGVLWGLSYFFWRRGGATRRTSDDALNAAYPQRS